MNPYFTAYNVNPRIENLIDPESGEIFDFEQFMALQMEKQDAIEALIGSYKNHLMMADGIKADMEEKKIRVERHKKAAENAKKALEQILGGEKYESASGVVSYRKSESVNITDSNTAGRWLASHGYPLAVKMEEVYTPDKKAVKDLLKSGVQVPSAEIVTKLNMGVR